MNNKKLELHCSSAKLALEAYKTFFFSKNMEFQTANRYAPFNIKCKSYIELMQYVEAFKTVKHKQAYLILPETGLHPKQQAQFMHDVMHNSQEVYVFTHSEHIFHEIRLAVGEEYEPEDITIHFYKKNEIVYPKINYQGRIDIWSEGFFDQSEIQLEDLLNTLHPLHLND